MAIKKEVKVKKKNPWLVHIKEFRKENPTMKFSEVLVKAKKTYKK